MNTVLLSIKASLCENVFCPSKIGGRKEKDCTFRRKTLKSALSSHRQKSRPEFEIEVKTADKIFSLPTFGKSGLLSVIFWLHLRTKFDFLLLLFPHSSEKLTVTFFDIMTDTLDQLGPKKYSWNCCSVFMIYQLTFVDKSHGNKLIRKLSNF